MKEVKSQQVQRRKRNKKEKKGKKGKGKGGKDDEEKKPRIIFDFHVPPPPLPKISELINEAEDEVYSHSIHKTIKTDQWYTGVRPWLIKETLNIPEASTEVRTLLESYNMYMIDREYKKVLLRNYISSLI